MQQSLVRDILQARHEMLKMFSTRSERDLQLGFKEFPRPGSTHEPLIKILHYHVEHFMK